MQSWDHGKKKAFVKSMGKHKLSRFAKGGKVRKYMADGGTLLQGPQGVGYNSSQTVNNNGLTGTISNLLGENNNFQAQGATITPGTNYQQLNQAYQGVQGALGRQESLADLLTAQGAQGAESQAALTGQLQGIINGTGPNPAQAQLAQNTANNIANQTAMAAGQRGAAGNVGLLARQAAQAGSGMQQQATGQAATLQAQQQIAAQQQLQELAANQLNQQAGAVQGLNNAQQNEQNILQGANTSANNAGVSMQGNINSVNAGVAAGNQAQANKTAGSISSALSSLPVVGQIFGGFAKGGEVHLADGGGLQVKPPSLPPQNSAPWLSSVPVSTPTVDLSSGDQSAPNTIDTLEFDKPEKKKGSGFDGLFNWLSGAGGVEGGTAGAGGASAGAGAMGGAGAGMGGAALPEAAMLMARGGGVHQLHSIFDQHFESYFKGGRAKKVPAMVSPGEIYLSPDKVREVVEEGKNPLTIGEKFKGKAKVKGDSLKNDILPKTLQDGGIVIPRHITEDKKMTREKAELFVHRHHARKKMEKER